MIKQNISDVKKQQNISVKKTKTKKTIDRKKHVGFK